MQLLTNKLYQLLLLNQQTRNTNFPMLPPGKSGRWSEPAGPDSELLRSGDVLSEPGQGDRSVSAQTDGASDDCSLHVHCTTAQRAGD